MAGPDLNKNGDLTMPADATNSVITLDDIHLTLGEGASQVHVLRGISLDVEAGKSIGIVGPSGSGKSTLLMVMAGLERVDKGGVTLAGEDFFQAGRRWAGCISRAAISALCFSPFT